ncbi:MAG: tetratricopeptide repeat protein [Deltaproteobacteria bacterium]|nr:tetratricopeptide repeat protein [Deltaproteobacteria bacterium]
MGDDEVATIHTLASYRELMTTIIQQSRGRVIDSPGDNLLAEFASVVDAVQCAMDIQHNLQERNAELEPSRRMEFRIGVNVGDVIVEGDRIYGDGVNIAARLESLAEGGGICISSSVHEQVENKLPFKYVDMGEQTVKNIARPVRVFRVRMEPEQDGAPSLRTLTLPDKPSIAVLPFLNLSGDLEQVYFSDGITEDLITDLSKLSGLFVISRNSVFLYKEKAVRPEQVGLELGVRYVLEGSVRKAGNRVRITAQLIDAATGYHLWAERYDRELQDIFAVQDEVTQKIVSALQVKLTMGEQGRLKRPPTQNLEAYDCFLRGLEYRSQRTQESNTQARRMFERAIELDPQFASAYAVLGLTYLTEIASQWNQDPHAADRLLQLAQHAVALDDAQPAAYETLAYAYLTTKQHEQAMTAAERAVALDPNSADAYQALGDVLIFIGRGEEAVILIEKAMRLNPRHPVTYLWTLGQAYRLVGKQEEAVSVLQRAIVRNPDYLAAHMLLAVVFYDLSRNEEARAEAAEVLRINPQYSLDLVRQRMPIKDPTALAHFMTALEGAGLQ